MDKDQVEKVTAALAKVREQIADDLAKLRERDTSAEEREKILAKVRETNDKALSSALKPDQMKRLHQIENQMAGVRVFSQEQVQKDLKLSDDQKDSIKEIGEEAQKEMGELFRGGFNQDSMKKVRALQKETMDKVRKVLNDDQKKALKDLLGEPFEINFPGFGGGGGPGVGGGPFGPGGPPQPGQVLSPGLQDRLKLTAEQKKQIEELQKDIDARLGKILTDEQKKQLKDMQQGAPGGRLPGGPGGGGGERSPGVR